MRSSGKNYYKQSKRGLKNCAKQHSEPQSGSKIINQLVYKYFITMKHYFI